MKTSTSLNHLLIIYIGTVITLTALCYVIIYDSIRQYQRIRTVELYETLYYHIKEKIIANDLNFENLLTNHIDRDVSYQLMLVMPSGQPYVHQFYRQDQPNLTFFTLPYWQAGSKAINYQFKDSQLLGYSGYGENYQLYIQAYYPPLQLSFTRFIYWLPLIIALCLISLALLIAHRRGLDWHTMMVYLDEVPKRIHEPYQPIRFQNLIKGQELLRLSHSLNRIIYQLHHSHRRIKLLLVRIEHSVEHAPLPLLLVKRNGQIIFFNKRFEQLFMTSFEESVTYFLVDFLMGVDKSTQIALAKLDNERTSSILNVTNLERNNSHYQLHLNPWFGKQGQVQGFSAILNDVSHFTQTIIESQNKNDQQQEQLNEFDKLWSILGHELRTPLSGMLGMLELMEQDNFTPDQKETYITLEQTSQTMLTMLNDMLDVAKMEAGKLQVITERTDILVLCQQVADLMTDNARRQNIELLCYFDPQCPRYFTTDTGRLRQALLNLLSNAIKFTDSGYVALVVSDYDTQDTVIQSMLLQSERLNQLSNIKHWICFSIKDTGIGISHQDKQKLFSHFNQANESISRQFGGTGLGLAISNNFAQLLGGFIHVESNTDQGSTFSLCLPFKETSYQPVYQYNTEFSNLLLIAFTSQDISTSALFKLSNHLNIAASICTGINKAHIDKLNNQDLSSFKPIILIDYELYATEEMALIEQLKCAKNAPKILLSMMPERGITDKVRQQYAGFLTKPLNVSHFVSELLRLSNYSSKPHLTINNLQSSKVQQSFEDFMSNMEQPKTPGLDCCTPLNIDNSNVKSDNTSRLILVAEDNIINQKVVCKILSKLGYLCLLANNGKEVLDYLETRRKDIDLILMDCRMPQMDGLEATKHIRSNKDTIPIIALTANDTDADRKECFRVGMNGFLAKPIKKEALEKILTKFIIH